MTMTITIQFEGRLGNQMFQYAMLRSVAAVNGYRTAIPAHNLLSCFSIESDIFSVEDASQIIHRYEERDSSFQSDVFSQPAGTRYFGFFQSELYFKKIASQIRREFSPLPKIQEKLQSSLSDINLKANGKALVGVHVRRGDYVDKKAFFRPLPPAYFLKGMNYALRHCCVGAFCIFSDDLEWCRRHFPTQLDLVPLIFISKSEVEDMFLLSLCNHYILSGSSFSWWGAWLGAKSDSLVIVPEPWFGPQNMRNTSDLIPFAWKKLRWPHPNLLHTFWQIIIHKTSKKRIK